MQVYRCSGTLPGPGELLPAEDRKTPEQNVSLPPNEQTDSLYLLRARDERAAVWYSEHFLFYDT